MVGAVRAVPVRVRLLDVAERRPHNVARRVLGAHPVLVPPGLKLHASQRQGRIFYRDTLQAAKTPC